MHERLFMTRTKTVIVGAGFAGLEVARRLRRAYTDVLLIDRLNHHLFQPLLYQVASAALSPGDIAAPVRSILADQKNATFIMGTVTAVDKAEQKIILADNKTFHYDYLVLAPGVQHFYFGHDEWEAIAPSLKTLQDAEHIREHILMAFEKAERAKTHQEAMKYLRFAVVGGGPTGVEMAGAIAEIAFHTLARDFRKIRPDQAKVFLIEGAPHILPAYPPDLARKGEAALKKLGVSVLCNHMVTNITSEGIYFGDKFLEAPTVIWAAANRVSPLIETVGTPADKMGRAFVDPDLSIPGYENIFIIGDAAHCKDKRGNPLPGLAPVAKQEGSYVAEIITKCLAKTKRPPFSYWDKGSLATIGKGKAVGMVKNVHLSGFFAWLAWCFIHVFYLIGFRNRMLVLVQWFFLYITERRSVQLITDPIDEPS